MTAQDSVDPIAVVGMAGRFPGAPDVNSLWNLLMEGRHAIRPVPDDRWDAAAPLDPEREIQGVGGFLDGVDLFDAEFFGVSPREAAAIDPQQRLFLEAGWRALEDAGQPAAALSGSRTGVYVGASWHDYELLRMNRRARPTPHSLVGNALDVIAARLSYVLGLRGPSMTVESGCSSSLVALHLAAQALRQGEIDSALVGGTNLMLDPHVTVGLTHFGGLSPDGRCAAFSSGANGFVRGEGVAALYVKTLSRALADGDRIHGLIVRTVVNNDGGGDSLVTPSSDGQEDLLRRAYADGVVPGGAPAYIEAHGTGTGRGDPIEASAIGRVLGADRKGNPLLIGSVKTNIGHLEACAGLAGLFKLLLSMRHRTIPPSLHSEELNPEIPFDDLNLRVVREPTVLPADGPLYMGVNSFGWGGTNAHTVVASPPVPAAGPAGAAGGRAVVTGLPAVVTLSAKQPPALVQRAADLAAALPEVPTEQGEEPTRRSAGGAATGPALDTTALAGALAWRRDHFPVRAALVASSPEELRPALDTVAAGLEEAQHAPGVVTGQAVSRGRTAFVFPGQGSQWSGMGRDLYEASPLFADVIDRCGRALRPHTDWELTRIFSGETDDTWTTRIDMLQPTLWAMSLGLAELWRAAGVEPDVVLGHSQGEITAATLAGILSYDDAALVMARRSSIARKTSGHGRMLAVDLGRQEAQAALEGFEDTVALAVHNGPSSCVLSGDTDDVLLLKELLEAENVYCRLVNVDYASHSPQMDQLHDELLSALAPALPGVGTIDLMSTVRVGLLEGPEMDAEYWSENLRRPVRFADAMSAVLDEGVTHVVEISPHPVLAPAIEQLAAARPEPPAVLHTLRRGHGTPADAALALARGYVAGLEPFAELPRQYTVPVPGHPMRRDSFWTPRRSGGTVGATHGFEPPLTPAPGENGTWTGRAELSLSDLPWLGDHKVYGTAVLPGTAMLTLAVNTALARTGASPTCLRRVDLRKEVVLGDTPLPLTVEWRDYTSGPTAAHAGSFRLLSLPEGADAWDVVMTARVDARETQPAAPAQVPSFPGWHTRTEATPAESFYADCARRGLDYGPAFRTVRRLFTHESGESALAEIRLSDRLRVGNRPHVLHPALWDGALQTALTLYEQPGALVPTAVATVRLLTEPAEPVTTLWSLAVRRDAGLADVYLYDDQERPLLALEGLELRELPDTETPGPDGERLHHLAWTQVTEPETAESHPVAGHWLVCGAGDGDGRASALVAALRSAGATARYRDVAGEPDPAGPPDAVVFLAPAGGPEAGRGGLLALTGLVRSYTAPGTPPRLAVVTTMAQAVSADDVVDPGAALYWGFTRALRREHGELEPRLIDCDVSDPDWATHCARLLLTGSASQDQVALRRGRVLAARITRGTPAEEAGTGLPVPRTPRQPFRVGVLETGQGRHLRCLPLSRRVPGPGEIEIEVTAGALDPWETAADRTGTGPYGMECAGTVVAVGPGVDRLAVGDRVAACARGALASHVTVRADHAQRIPAELNDTQAAALPYTLAAAWHALTRLGQIASGETVLIHAAASGLGHAALSIARALGARVIATADSEAARESLRADGVTDVFDSTNPGWADEVRAVTGGRGVDVVCNTLSGEALSLGLDVLAEDGRFIEISGREPHGGRRLGLETLSGAGASLFVVDLAGLPERRPELFASAQQAAWELLTAAKLKPPSVCARRFTDADEAMDGALIDPADGHFARICLTEPESVRHVVAEPLPGDRLRPDGAYLITGGLGALGLSLAEYLAANGAGTLVLLGRSHPGPQAEERLAALRAGGTAVHALRCDVSQVDALREALETVRGEGPPLRGVIHAAGLLADATVRNVTERQLAEVLAPKVSGALALDAVTEDDPLDFFVFFSSAAALVGNAGQAVYSAANAYLDAFAEARRRRGLPALSVQWGPFAEMGLAASGDERGARLEARGMGSFPAHEAWPALMRMLNRDVPVTGYVPINPRQWFDAYPDTAALDSWERLRAAAEDPGRATGGAFLTRLRETPRPAWPDLVKAEVRELAGRVLRLAPERIGDEAPFKALGLDSLMSLELRNRLEAAFGTRLSPTTLWAYGTPKALSAYLGEQLSRAEDPD